jgi:hypothetical protein
MGGAAGDTTAKLRPHVILSEAKQPKRRHELLRFARDRADRFREE